MIAKAIEPGSDEAFETTFETGVRQVFHGGPWEQGGAEAAAGAAYGAHAL